MVLAGGVNISMLLLAASALGGVSATDSLPAIFVALESYVAPIADGCLVSACWYRALHLRL